MDWNAGRSMTRFFFIFQQLLCLIPETERRLFTRLNVREDRERERGINCVWSFQNVQWKRGYLLLGVVRTIVMRAICRPSLFFSLFKRTILVSSLVEFLSTRIFSRSNFCFEFVNGSFLLNLRVILVGGVTTIVTIERYWKRTKEEIKFACTGEIKTIESVYSFTNFKDRVTVLLLSPGLEIFAVSMARFMNGILDVARKHG